MDSAAVLSFWFSGGKQRWFEQRDETDQAIRERFGDLYAQAVDGRLDAWAQRADSRLALIILLDQFTRNLHRDTGEAWANDPRAQALALEGIERGHDRELLPIQRAFMYMPLMHAEDRALQERSVEQFSALESEAELGFVRHAVMHRDIVARFGRFPHRNALLNRTSTEEEAAYLAGGAPTFGVKSGQ